MNVHLLLKKPLLFFAGFLFLLSLATPVGAQLATWDFEGDVTTASAVTPGITANNATFGTGVGSIGFVGGDGGGRAYTANNWAGAISRDTMDYLEFKISAACLSTTSISWSAKRSGTGPASYEVRYSTNNFSSSTQAATGTISGTNFNDFTTSVVLNSVAQVSIRIFAFNSSGTGGTLRFDNVSISGATCTLAPYNDLCGDAIELECGTPVLGTTIGYGNSDAPPQCSSSVFPSDGVWFTFTDVTNQEVTVSTVNAGTNNSFDTGLSVYTSAGGCGGPFTCETVNDDAAGTSQSTVVFIAQANVTYYIYLDGFGNVTGDYELSVDCAAACQMPEAICQNITVQLDANGNASITAADVDGGSTAECGLLDLEVSTTDFTCSDVGQNPVTLTITDNNEDFDNCMAIVTVEDNVAPTALCQNLTLQLDVNGNASIIAADVNGGSSDACGIANLMATPTAFDCEDVGNNSVLLTVTDVNGNAANCTATVNVEDNVPPTALCQNVTVQLDANGNGTTTATAVDNGSNDACGIFNTFLTQTSFGCDEVGPNSVDLIVADNNGKTNFCTATVTVEDNAPPTAVCQNFTLNLTSAGSTTLAAADIDGSSSTACGTFSLSAAPSSFTCDDLGPQVVILTVTDDSNSQTDDCTAIVTVADPENYCCDGPEALCQNITVQLNNNGDASIIPGDVDGGSTADCGLQSLTVTPTDFTCGDKGANTVTLTITDIKGQSDACTATVTVQDNVAPTASCQNITVQLDANGNASITAADINSGSTDACGIANLMAAPTAFDCEDVGNNSVLLTVTDVNGNAANCTAIVTVEDNVAPVITLCQGNSIDFNGEASFLSSTGIDFSATDACGIASTTYNPEYISCEQLGETVPVTVTVTDVNGKSSSCVANVLVTGLPCGFMDFGDDGIGCIDHNDASYNVPTETFTLVSEGCYSTNWSADDAAYVKYALCGDGQIIAHVGSISPLGQGWAGISMRESNAPGSKKVALATNLSNFGRREVRTTTNGYSIPQQFFRPGASWLKLVRTGNQFIGYMSSDGTNWQMVLGTNVSMNSCIELGLYVTNYNGSSTVTGTFDHVQIIGSGGLGLSTPALSAGTTEALHFDAVDFSIFPNPAKEEVQLDLINYYGQQAKVEILNQLGQPVLQRQLDEVGSSPERFEVTSLSSGTYFIRVSTDEGQKVKRFLIVK